MRVGDYVETPRFLRVKIQEVLSAKEARDKGYVEPTHFDKHPIYAVLGKVIGTNRMHFAAVVKVGHLANTVFGEENKTQLSWHHVLRLSTGEQVFIWDTWEIPYCGAQVWCTAWTESQTIVPHGDGFHVILDHSLYQCKWVIEQLMEYSDSGYSWGIEGVPMVRHKQVDGTWQVVDVV